MSLLQNVVSFHRALLQKRPVMLRSLPIEDTPYVCVCLSVSLSLCMSARVKQESLNEEQVYRSLFGIYMALLSICRAYLGIYRALLRLGP